MRFMLAFIICSGIVAAGLGHVIGIEAGPSAIGVASFQLHVVMYVAAASGAVWKHWRSGWSAGWRIKVLLIVVHLAFLSSAIIVNVLIWERYSLDELWWMDHLLRLLQGCIGLLIAILFKSPPSARPTTPGPASKQASRRTRYRLTLSTDCR
jgi:hypothetical protein